MAQELSQLSETPPLPGAVAIPNINKIIRTIATDFAGSDDPAGMAWPYCTWADTGNNLKKRRNAANSAWVVEGELFQQTARRNGDPTQDFSANNISISSVNGGQLAGFRNKILNGRFNINQGGAASRTAAVGYNFDQWYYDGTYLYQPIPTEDVYDGTYTLSWEGNSTAAWSLNATGSSGQGSQTYTPVDNGGQIVVSGKTNQHLWVRFATDLANLDKVQLEPGDGATPYEDRFESFEEFLCQLFYEELSLDNPYPNGTAIHANNRESAEVPVGQFIRYTRSKRITPSILITGGGSGRYVTNTGIYGPNNGTASAITKHGFNPSIDSAPAASFGWIDGLGIFKISARI